MLSPEQFAELIAVIETTCDDGSKSEVRRSQRVPHPCRITITMGTSADAGPGYLVQLKDISARGMCFLHNEKISNSQIFVAKLESPDGHCVAVLSHVVHCKQLDEHTYQVGAEFTCVLNKNKQENRREMSAEDLMRIRTPVLR